MYNAKSNSDLLLKINKRYMSCNFIQFPILYAFLFFLTHPVKFPPQLIFLYHCFVNNYCAVKLSWPQILFPDMHVYCFYPQNQRSWSCPLNFTASPWTEWCSIGQTDGGERGSQGSGMAQVADDRSARKTQSKFCIKGKTWGWMIILGV